MGIKYSNSFMGMQEGLPTSIAVYSFIMPTIEYNQWQKLELLIRALKMIDTSFSYKEHKNIIICTWNYRFLIKLLLFIKKNKDHKNKFAR
jgi:hypothetical protein